jgi:hypothetical protein
VFATAIHFHSSLVFASKAGAYQSGAPFQQLTPMVGFFQSCPQILDYGGCDDYITAKNFAVKCFIVQAPGEKMAKKFYKTGAL